ncbi:spermidine synthase [Arthrobacter sp. StoSoilB3]|uniref:spermidine synthase n=1 Tax=Paenarthrobacter nicotinovorans TaxID=29320 RepID=UPI001E771812|nr:spermidine synthase [Arthrobacter sp. NtRootA2]BCW15196.1 spermidine synthase [Arthrobacter sp. NtRootA4]BCW23531.1 spermidine synthase [Arthrobacter sp. NtRootC7]BCW27799.1 spermidine synthase [Arthrobacter sp. NtRootC45]BCW32067.1 spermidine synthase [Arthrobacter sp. NtRootD5]BCW40954.1 spermidine synthase [Arthrobacter sp. StoSoilB3]
MNSRDSGHAARFLRTSGQHATIDTDPLVEGSFILSIGGAEQSHVNLAAPGEIFYEYLRRIGHVVDLAAEPGSPIRALHLGAGALTLARYIQATRPGSEQYAVELERELLDFVLQKLPMPDGTRLTSHIGDARDALAQLPAEAGFDVVILDIFSGPEAPSHIACREFYEEAAARLAPDGVLIVNVGDEPALTLVRSQVSALRKAMPDVAAFAEAGMFEGRYPGNIILVGTRTPWPAEWTAELLARGPHPAAVLTGVDLDRITG